MLPSSARFIQNKAELTKLKALLNTSTPIEGNQNENTEQTPEVTNPEEKNREL